MGADTDAAKSLRMIWQGHDELDVGMCVNGASELYRVLTNAHPELRLEAAKYLQQAFWLSDKAESYQEKDPDIEDSFYKKAGNCLTRSRALMGLETASVGYTIAWWKAYRHKDKEALLENLVLEHMAQIKGSDENLAKQCASIILEAAAEHKKKDWAAVDKKLEEYFEVYLPHI